MPVGRQPGRLGPSAARRFTLTAVGAPAAGLATHLAGGGMLPTSSVVMLAALALGTLAAGAAMHLALRSRGLWAAWCALVCGQLAIELALRSPVGHASPTSLWSAGIHLLAAALLTGVLLGGERVAADLSDLLDRWVPRSRTPLPVIDAAADRRPASTRPELRGADLLLPRSPRGPPHA